MNVDIVLIQVTTSSTLYYRYSYYRGISKVCDASVWEHSSSFHISSESSPPGQRDLPVFIPLQMIGQVILPAARNARNTPYGAKGDPFLFTMLSPFAKQMCYSVLIQYDVRSEVRCLTGSDSSPAQLHPDSIPTTSRRHPGSIPAIFPKIDAGEAVKCQYFNFTNRIRKYSCVVCLAC